MNAIGIHKLIYTIGTQELNCDRETNEPRAWRCPIGQSRGYDRRLLTQLRMVTDIFQYSQKLNILQVSLRPVALRDRE
jgi:hypothetical protein